MPIFIVQMFKRNCNLILSNFFFFAKFLFLIQKRYFLYNAFHLHAYQTKLTFATCRAFQEHTEKMRQKLHEQMIQKVDDEDSRIAKAVEQREKKRLVSATVMV